MSKSFGYNDAHNSAEEPDDEPSLLDQFSQLEEDLRNRIGPWAKVPLWILDRDIKSGSVLLYSWLSAKYGGSPKGIYPGQRKLSADLRVSEDSIQRWTQELVEIGALKVKRRGQGKTNLYTLMAEPPEIIL